MKKIVFLALTLFSVQSFCFSNGQIQNAPYSVQLKNLIDLSTLNGQHVRRFAKGLWDTNITGGTTVGTYKVRQDLGKPNYLQLPANSTIEQVYYYVKTPALGSATTGTTWSVTCGNATLFTAADISNKAVNTYFAGNQTGTAATMSDVGTSPCNVSVVVGTQGYTVSGKVDILIDYATHD